MAAYFPFSFSDRAIHYILVAIGLLGGSLIKTGFDRFAEFFWNTEWQEFQKWKSKNRS